MGIYDRDYVRDDHDQTGFRMRIPYSMTNRIIAVNVIVYLVDVFLFQGKLSDHLAMRVSSLTEPWMWWQMLTAGFLHSIRDPWHILGNMLVLWFFGRDVEKVYGRAEFLRVYLVMIVIASACWAAFGKYVLDYSPDSCCVGASGGVAGVLILFALRYPKKQVLLFFMLPMPAWVAGLLWVAFDFWGTINPDPTDNVGHSAHLAGMAFAFVYYRLGWNLGRLLPGKFSLSSLTPRPRLKVHDPASDDAYVELDEQADRLLEKVHREGESSLTAKERRALEAYSRRMQQKRR